MAGIAIRVAGLAALLGAALSAAPASADAPPVGGIAVVPYLAVGISDKDSEGLTEALAREVAARTGAKVKSGAQLKDQLPPIPDGCPTQPRCVADVSLALGVDRLLFASFLSGQESIEIVLSFVGGGDEKQTKFSLTLDPSGWGPAIRDGLKPVVPLGKRPALFKKWWFWGGVGVVAAGAAGAFLLQPSIGFIR